MGGPPPVLASPGRRRGAALVALLGSLALYDAGAGVLPDVGEAGDVTWTALVLVPATFGAVWALLPTARARGTLPVAAALGVLAVLLHLAGLGALFNVTKLAALTLFGFWFLELFQALSWVALVAVIVPWVDAVSVWRGPTEYVVSEQPGLFDRVSIAFRVPGEEASANIGPPDIVFFALFLAAATRFGLRAAWTWAAMTALLSLTLVATWALDVSGLPALPAICLGFLVPNADLVWRAVRREGLRLGDDTERSGS